MNRGPPSDAASDDRLATLVALGRPTDTHDADQQAFPRLERVASTVLLSEMQEPLPPQRPRRGLRFFERPSAGQGERQLLTAIVRQRQRSQARQLR